MRAVVMSMKPQWWEKILTREKTMEIRKTMPRGGAGGTEPWPMLVLVYVSGTGEIQGQFLCGGWVKTNLLAGMEKQSCVPLRDLVEYAGGPGGSLCGWIVKDPSSAWPARQCPGNTSKVRTNEWPSTSTTYRQHTRRKP